MSTRPVLRMGHPLLRQAAKSVMDDEIKSEEFSQLIKDMHDTMKQANGLGLAANQVSVGIRMLTKWGIKTFINPTIVERAKETQLLEEGCLSFHNLFLRIPRSKHVVVEYYDEKLNKLTGDNNFGYIWGINYIDNDEVIECEWFKTRQERNKKYRGINDKARNKNKIKKH